MFTQYTPKDPLPHVLYAQDENGVDWYEYIRNLDNTTPKILVTKAGVVACMGTDAEIFPFPDGLEFYQVKSFPKGESVSWRYLKGKFIRYEDTPEYKSTYTKRSLTEKMEQAKATIDALRIEKEYTELSEEKAEQLKQAARDYISAKNELEALDGSVN